MPTFSACLIAFLVPLLILTSCGGTVGLGLLAGAAVSLMTFNVRRELQA